LRSLSFQFVGEWEQYSKYPLPIGEGQGAIVGDEMILISGFSGTFDYLTPKNYALDLKTPVSGSWREMDPFPIAVGISHTAHAIDKSKGIIYVCGGYVGPHPGPPTAECFSFSPSAPSGSQWVILPSLPGERAAGAMWYNSKANSLIFGAGASRTDPTNPGHTVDQTDVWELKLNNRTAGWESHSIRFPYTGNHLGRTTVNFKGSGDRYFVVGGQDNENEYEGNHKETYELNPSTFEWMKRADMPFPRGHISESTIAFNNCGFIIIAGAVNRRPDGETRTKEIHYYDIETDKWSPIGNFTVAVATPICGVHGHYVYCQSGHVHTDLSVRRRITV
jgi:N-acetylneuraminic acid mutarotase